MTLYEKATWQVVNGVPTLVRNPAWDIGQMMTVHRDGCAIRLELHRTAGDHDSARRAEAAAATVCTCGHAIRPLDLRHGRDTRDLRDPSEIGREILAKTT